MTCKYTFMCENDSPYLFSVDPEPRRLQAALQLRQQGGVSAAPALLQGRLLLELLHLGLQLLAAPPRHLRLLQRAGQLKDNKGVV